MAKPAIRQLAGDIRFWEVQTNGSRLPVIPEANDPDGNQPVETNALSFSYEAGDEISVVSKRRDARYNQPIHSDQLPGTTNVSATLLELPPLILARILFGSGTGATVAAGSVTEGTETITVARLGVPLQLAYRLASSLVVKKGATTLVEGTDYTVSAAGLRRGQFMPVAGGAIEADDELDVAYSYAAQVSVKILGGATPTKKFYITGDMQDRITGENGELRIPEVSLSVDGDVDWLSSEPIQAVMTGTAVVADGEEAPYTFTTYKATA